MTADGFRRRGRNRGCSRTPASPDYRLLQQRIGTSRIVVVTPAAYLTDNEVTLDAIAQLGAQARGVAVVHPTVTDAELKRMADGGIRGIRFTQFDPKTATTTIDMIEPLARRVQALGWHVQIHLRADQIVAADGSAAAAAGHDRVRSSRPADTAGGTEPSGVRASSAGCSTAAAPG